MSDMEAPLLPTDEEKKPEDPPVDAAPQESIFWNKFKLALSISFWVSLFYVPLIIPPVHQWFFVDLDVPNLLNSPDFESYWPNTVQLIVFTVYFSTGSTVNLAWQGLAGTVVSGMNQVFMGKLFPQGGKCLNMAASTGNGIRGFCEEFADPNYGKFEWFVWFDFFFFLFLLLSSNAKENTMKFGMSWHIVYMMSFMSPAGYQPSHAVNITTVFGVSLAILITLIPSKGASGIVFKQMVAKNLTTHPLAIAKTVREMSQGTVKFILADKPVNPIERYHYKVDKVAIQLKVESLEGMATAMNDDWNTSWWEGWLYSVTGGGPSAVTEFRRIRTHCGIFAKAFADDIGGFDDVAYVMQKAVSAIEAGSYKFMPDPDMKDLQGERQQMRGYVEGLNKASNDLLLEISNYKEAPKNEEEMTTYAAKVQGMKQDVDQRFSELFQRFSQWRDENPVAEKSAARQILRANMSVFIFSILQLAKEVMDLSDTVIEKYKKNVGLTESELTKNTLSSVRDEFTSTYITGGTPAFVKALMDGNKRSFVFRNMTSIGICFTMGNLLQGSVFKSAFNPLLAGTLAVLISHFPGSAFYKNLMRLLGLAIGNALPVVLLAPVSLFSHDWRPYAHLLMFFLFELYFCLMYFTSPEWSYIGCIVAGFGCYSFTTDTWNDASFEAAYCKIGQVTAAITIQIIVDMVDTKLRKKFPQDIVVANMRTLTTKAVEVFEMFKKHMNSPEPDSKLMDSIKAMSGDLKSLMASQEQLVSECEAKTIMIAGPGPSFRLDLYKGALKAVKDILCESDALCLVDEFSEKVGRNNSAGEWFSSDYTEFYDRIITEMRQSFQTLMLILEKKDEGLVPKSKVKVCLLEEDPTHQTPSMRMAVVKRIMGDLLKHVLEIERLCCDSGCLEFEI